MADWQLEEPISVPDAREFLQLRRVLAQGQEILHRQRHIGIRTDEFGTIIFSREDIEDLVAQEEALARPSLPVESLVEQARAAIDGLTELALGWDGYDGIPVHAQVAEHALRFLDAIGVHTQLVPDIVPLSDGGLQLEWYVGTYELEVAIGPDCEAEAYFECKRDGRIEEMPIDAALDVSHIAPLFRELRR